jgi:hypothetical protein
MSSRQARLPTISSGFLRLMLRVPACPAATGWPMKADFEDTGGLTTPWPPLL